MFLWFMNENLRPLALGRATSLQVAPSVSGAELVLGGSMEIKPQTPLAVRPLPLAKTPLEAWAVAPGTNLMILDGVVQELSLLLCCPSSPPVSCLVAGPLPSRKGTLVTEVAQV